MPKEVRLTQKGKENLERELDELKTTKRDEIAEKIEIARSYGDLSENAEYDEAKNDQAVLERRGLLLVVFVGIDQRIVPHEAPGLAEQIHVAAEVEIGFRLQEFQIYRVIRAVFVRLRKLGMSVRCKYRLVVAKIVHFYIRVYRSGGEYIRGLRFAHIYNAFVFFAVA